MSAYTLDSLIETLTEIRDSGTPGDTRLLIAYQPSWPLRANVENVRVLTDDDGYDHSDQTAVWIAASSSVGYDDDPYAPHAAWDED